jgi:hypothetical protein
VAALALLLAAVALGPPDVGRAESPPSLSSGFSREGPQTGDEAGRETLATLIAP